LNIPEHQESLKEFIPEKYKALDVKVSGVHTKYKIYFTKTLEDVEQIDENIKVTFLDC
jgi:hypothetical protein